jgi:hypothetical protein
MNRCTCRRGSAGTSPVGRCRVVESCGRSSSSRNSAGHSRGEIPAFPINESDQTTTEVERMDTGPTPRRSISAHAAWRASGQAGSGHRWPGHSLASSTGTIARRRPRPVTPRRVGGRHWATSIDIVTLSDREDQGERARSRRYLKSVSGVSDVAIRAFELRRGQCYLKPCVRRSRRGVTHVTCANPLLADALWPCYLAPGPRERHVYDAKPPSDLDFSEMGFR